MGPPWGAFCQITLTSCFRTQCRSAMVLGSFARWQRPTVWRGARLTVIIITCITLLNGTWSLHLQQLANCYSTQRGSKMTPPTCLWGSESVFCHVWSWPSILLPSCPCPMDYWSQLASKLVHSFSKYNVHKFRNRRTDGRKDERTKGKQTVWPLRVFYS